MTAGPIEERSAGPVEKGCRKYGKGRVDKKGGKKSRQRGQQNLSAALWCLYNFRREAASPTESSGMLIILVQPRPLPLFNHPVLCLSGFLSRGMVCVLP